MILIYILLTLFLIFIGIDIYLTYRCKHDYKLEKEINFYASEDRSKTTQVLLLYKCTKCPKFKKVWIKSSKIKSYST